MSLGTCIATHTEEPLMIARDPSSTNSALDSSSHPVDGRTFRDCMGKFATGVAVAATVSEEGERVAVTVNSLTSVSLSPPMVLFCLDVSARSLPTFRRTGTFALSILSLNQQDLSSRFASGSKDWDDVPVTTWRTGAPILTGALAALDCRLTAVYPGGDHEILLGTVEQCALLTGGLPLLYHAGDYAGLTE
jgi:flavin reductase (DIM6/NTAB) family NADH-FMN oxidoreductase RutF